ncbi:MAG: RagB/SusD family nutrient uptake outer membrane protein [Rikenellaceae bacterium]
MKKIFKKFLFILALSAGMTSCHDVLNIMPDGQYTLDDIFSNEVTTGAYLNSCYEDMPKWGYYYNYITNGPVAWSDDSHLLYQSNYPSTAYVGATTLAGGNQFIANKIYGGTSVTSWDLFFRNIRRCNIFLNRIDAAVVPLEQNRAEWKAEARLLRAFYFMELVTRFGGLPIIDEVLPADCTGSDLVREDFKTCADFIISECREILKEDELEWRPQTSSNYTRLTRGAAAAIMSRTALFMASPLFCDGNDYWDEAEAITKEALDILLANGFELYTESRDDLYEGNTYWEYITSDFTPTTQDPTDKESIYMATSMTSKVFIQSNTPYQTGAWRCGPCPTQELVDSYPMTDGSYVLDLEQPYNDLYHLEPNFNNNSSYNENDPYINRDPRFYATIYHNGSTMLNDTGDPVTVESYAGGAHGFSVSSNKYSMTGYYIKKYVRADATIKKTTSVGFRVFRLAELYLNYAEAAAENGNVVNAVEAVRPIRERVDMPNITPSNQDEAILMIRNERRIEFGMEEQRYNDVRRWQNPDGEMLNVKYVTGMYIFINDDGDYEYHRVRVGQTYARDTGEYSGETLAREHYTNKYLFHAIEQDEATKLEALTGVKWQNPGWI